jgi:acyl carrier protein
MTGTAERVIRIIADKAVLDASTLTPETRLGDLGIDSLGMVEAIFAIEEEFDIAIPFNASTPEAGSFDMTSVGSVVDGVERLIAARG